MLTVCIAQWYVPVCLNESIMSCGRSCKLSIMVGCRSYNDVHHVLALQHKW